MLGLIGTKKSLETPLLPDSASPKLCTSLSGIIPTVCQLGTKHPNTRSYGLTRVQTTTGAEIHVSSFQSGISHSPYPASHSCGLWPVCPTSPGPSMSHRCPALLGGGDHEEDLSFPLPVLTLVECVGTQGGSQPICSCEQPSSSPRVHVTLWSHDAPVMSCRSPKLPKLWIGNADQCINGQYILTLVFPGISSSFTVW